MPASLRAETPDAGHGRPSTSPEGKLRLRLKFFFGASMTRFCLRKPRDLGGGMKCSQSKSSERRKSPGFRKPSPGRDRKAEAACSTWGRCRPKRRSLLVVPGSQRLEQERFEGCLASMEASAAEQPSSRPPHLGDHCIHDGDFVVLKREDVFKAVQVQRRK